MKHAFLPRLRCPISGGDLRLHSFETEVIDADGESVTVTKEGVLLSESEKVWYPINNYVPVLLTFKTKFHDWFHELHKDTFTGLAGYRMPYRECEEGERFIQQSFTEQWNLTQESALSFVRTDDDLVTLNRHVWLQWIKPGQQFHSVLNVGCGIGQETMALREIVDAKEILAVDLNFALLQAGRRYKTVRNVQFVVCSLFHLPFRKASFDLVYSQGVIHHTWSTRAAFRSIASFVTKGGYLFIWVYGLDDHLTLTNSAGQSWANRATHVTKRLQYFTESLIRPWLSRSPAFIRRAVIFLLATVLHPLIRLRVIHRNLWKRSNTRHSLRDWLTPAYAFRHHTNEVVEWYEDLNFRIISLQSPQAHKRYFSGKVIHGVGVTGQRIDETPEAKL